MMGALELLTLALACWRLTMLLARDDWPFGAGALLRERVPFLACVYCASVWAAAGALLLWHALPVAVYVLAVAGGAMLLHRYTGGDAW